MCWTCSVNLHKMKTVRVQVPGNSNSTIVYNTVVFIIMGDKTLTSTLHPSQAKHTTVGIICLCVKQT